MSGQRVLVVDDEPQILRFLKPSLGAAGYDVITAATRRRSLEGGSHAGPGRRSCSISACPTWTART